jgi:glycine betaine/proline transport system ATP-binding protein
MNAMTKRSVPAIRCEGVWKVFGASRQRLEERLSALGAGQDFAEQGWVAAVRNATFEIAAGEIFVIMGLSGSGKSTMVRCLSRLIEPTIGKIFIEDQDLLSADEAQLTEIRRRKMGMVFQNFALLPNRNVLGNVAFPLQVQKVERRAREERAREMISLVGLEGREEHYPHELSGGQQQRVGIARSLSTNPAIWFLDEPFSALDPLIRNDLQDEVLRLQRQLGKTVVFITHDLDEAIKVADRIAIMGEGEIVQIGSPEDLVLRPATDYVARFTRNVPRAKVVRVATIMRPATAADEPGQLSVAPDQRVEEIASVIVQSVGAIAVRDASGYLLGYVDREKLIGILAGAETATSHRQTEYAPVSARSA